MASSKFNNMLYKFLETWFENKLQLSKKDYDMLKSFAREVLS